MEAEAAEVEAEEVMTVAEVHAVTEVAVTVPMVAGREVVMAMDLMMAIRRMMTVAVTDSPPPSALAARGLALEVVRQTRPATEGVHEAVPISPLSPISRR